MIFKKNLREHIELINKIDALEESINYASFKMISAIKNGGKLIFCGNGGSASDAQHIAAEFIGRFVEDRDPINAISITTDTSALTCISNDYDYSQVFARQVQGIGSKNDCLIGISTSGNSKNIENAIIKANEIGIYTIGLLGKGGGKISKKCDTHITVPSDITARIQEMHILIGHTIVEIVEKELF